MIVVDTNVVSGMMQDPSDAIVSRWLDRQAPTSIWTTSVTIFELRFGIEQLAKGRRREALFAALERLVREMLGGRVLAFDAAAAAETAILMATRRAAGRPVGLADGMIAGIVRTRRATVATRNLRHFADAGVAIVDPWSA